MDSLSLSSQAGGPTWCNWYCGGSPLQKCGKYHMFCHVTVSFFSYSCSFKLKIRPYIFFFQVYFEKICGFCKNLLAERKGIPLLLFWIYNVGSWELSNAFCSTKQVKMSYVFEACLGHKSRMRRLAADGFEKIFRVQPKQFIGRWFILHQTNKYDTGWKRRDTDKDFCLAKRCMV